MYLYTVEGQLAVVKWPDFPVNRIFPLSETISGQAGSYSLHFFNELIIIKKCSIVVVL